MVKPLNCACRIPHMKIDRIPNYQNRDFPVTTKVQTLQQTNQINFLNALTLQEFSAIAGECVHLRPLLNALAIMYAKLATKLIRAPHCSQFGFSRYFQQRIGLALWYPLSMNLQQLSILGRMLKVVHDEAKS
ncbi:Uncharacterized protein Fot_05525 [Forsythia ovata]|uniref:Uncharacterized protein n=1 Tax=Forsythia ovata TaxID=205694 RepID=A0ABD1WQD6_9LAMI